jgi:hypothetical protein
MAAAVPLRHPALRVYIHKENYNQISITSNHGQLSIPDDSILSIEYMPVIAGHNPNHDWSHQLIPLINLSANQSFSQSLGQLLISFLQATHTFQYHPSVTTSKIESVTKFNMFSYG